MSDQGYTPTEQELVAAWIQAHRVHAWGGWADIDSAPRTRIAEAHRGIAEVRREAAEEAWVKGYTAGWVDAVLLGRGESSTPSVNPHRKGVSNG